jgi:hypothetical protein
MTSLRFPSNTIGAALLGLKRGKRWWSGIGVALIAVGGLTISFGSSALAFTFPIGPVGTAAGFEDNDGNMPADQSINFDWNNFNAAAWSVGSAPYRQTAPLTVNGWQFLGLEDAQATTSDTSFAGGTKQDVNCPSVIGSKVPNKDDLKGIMLASKTGSNGHTYLMLNWMRIPQNSTSSSAHIGFEFNQGTAGACPAGSDGLVNRVAGDLLLVYDFTGGSTKPPTLSLSHWVTSGSCEVGADSPPCWNAFTVLPCGTAEANVDTGLTVSSVTQGSCTIPGGTLPASTIDLVTPPPPPATLSTTSTLGTSEFGEAGIDLTNAGVFGTKTCTTFGVAQGVSRSSGSSSTAAMEDLVGPGRFSLSNCGNLIIKKVTDPSSSTSFPFSVDGTPAPPPPATFPKTFNLTNGQTNSTQVFPGTYSAAETTVPTGWILTSATCDNGSGTLSSSTISDITVGLGETVTCTFNDQARGTIVIKKVTVPSSDTTTSFGFTTTGNIGTAGFSLNGGGTQTYSNVVPGSANTVSETVPVGWDLTSASCDNGNVPTTNITVTPGGTTTCTFTDTERGTIVIKKVTVPSSDTTTSFGFTTTGNIGTAGFSLNGGGTQTYSNVVPGSANTVSETVPVGWDLTSASCDNGNVPTTNITVTPGGTTTCTFTDTERGTIVIQKVTDPSPDLTNTSFPFTPGGSIGTTGFYLLNGGSKTYSNVAPASANTVSETVPFGWALTNATCDNGNVPTTNITVTPGGTTTCTFNDKLLHGAIKITKTSTKGTALLGATFAISGPNGYSNTVTSGADGTVCVDGLLFGSYNVQETFAPNGYMINDGTVHAVNVNASATCSDNPFGGVALSFADTPLTDITISASSEALGGTESTITCSPSFSPSSAGLSANPSLTQNGLPPGTYTCTVVVDP